MEQSPNPHHHELSRCPECGHNLDLPPPVAVLAQKAVEMTTITPAMKRARERREHEIQSFQRAYDEIARLSTQDWKSPIDLMYAVVDATGVSLATVNLAYHKYKKSTEQ